METVGLLTFHQVANYGAVLQCYALRKLIEAEGFPCRIIPHICPQLKRNEQYLKLNKSLPVSILKYLSQSGGVRKKRAAFDAFLRDCCGYPETAAAPDWNYGRIVVGSDQVWNLRLTGGDMAYYLKDVPCGRKIAYAASFGEFAVSQSDIRAVADYVKDFSRVSVRERTARELLRAENIDAEVVCDPVLAIGREEWARFTRPAFAEKRPYILVYCVEGARAVFDFARALSKSRNMRAVYINQKLFFREKGLEYVRGTSPEDFLNYFRYADAVVTNSFHGSAFSVIFGKPFAVDALWRGKPNGRVRNLLSEFGLQRTIQDISAKGISVFEEGIDFQAVWKKQGRMSRTARAFLHDALREPDAK